MRLQNTESTLWFENILEKINDLIDLSDCHLYPPMNPYPSKMEAHRMGQDHRAIKYRNKFQRKLSQLQRQSKILFKIIDGRTAKDCGPS